MSARERSLRNVVESWLGSEPGNRLRITRISAFAPEVVALCTRRGRARRWRDGACLLPPPRRVVVCVSAGTDAPGNGHGIRSRCVAAARIGAGLATVTRRLAWRSIRRLTGQA